MRPGSSFRAEPTLRVKTRRVKHRALPRSADSAIITVSDSGSDGWRVIECPPVRATIGDIAEDRFWGDV